MIHSGPAASVALTRIARSRHRRGRRRTAGPAPSTVEQGLHPLPQRRASGRGWPACRLPCGLAAQSRSRTSTTGGGVGIERDARAGGSAGVVHQRFRSDARLCLPQPRLEEAALESPVRGPRSRALRPPPTLPRAEAPAGSGGRTGWPRSPSSCPPKVALIRPRARSAAA